MRGDIIGGIVENIDFWRKENNLMVDFAIIMGELKVLVGGEKKLLGRIYRREGLLLDPAMVQGVVKLSSDDLREIACKVDEITQGGL